MAKAKPSVRATAPASADQQSDRLAEPLNLDQPPRLPFAVVGIGASAGGLEAFTEFLKTLAYPCVDETDNPVYRLFLR